MPTYQYECEACNHEFETSQSMSEPKLTKCPKCGQEKLARLIGSGSGMIFKGTGFYQTDYKNKPEAKPAAATEAKPAAVPAPSPSPTPSTGSCGSGCGCHPK